mmetsp:Transcript_820/g.2151  ORF Transcript_820/g.2151 Transcript_820/m.2151 type:complete len:361 (-) Transcript_820:6-1088(-)
MDRAFHRGDRHGGGRARRVWFRRARMGDARDAADDGRDGPTAVHSRLRRQRLALVPSPGVRVPVPGRLRPAHQAHRDEPPRDVRLLQGDAGDGRRAKLWQVLQQALLQLVRNQARVQQRDEGAQGQDDRHVPHARAEDRGWVRQRLRIVPEDAARARSAVQPRAPVLRHRLVRRGGESHPGECREVLQLRQGMPGEHAQRQLLRRRQPQVRRGGARGHAEPRRRVRVPALRRREGDSKRDIQNHRRSLRRRRSRGEVRRFGSQASQVPHGRGCRRGRGGGCVREGEREGERSQGQGCEGWHRTGARAAGAVWRRARRDEGGGGQGGGDSQAEGTAGHRGRALAQRGVRLVRQARLVIVLM